MPCQKESRIYLKVFSKVFATMNVKDKWEYNVAYTLYTYHFL